MTTFNLPTGSWPSSGVDVDNSAVTVVDGTGAVVLADYIGFKNSGTTNRSDPRNYPLQINNASSSGVVYQNINFQGNIPATTPWEQFYGQVSGLTAFNGTSFQLRTVSQSGKTVNGTFNNCVWGIRDNLSSGGADWVHHKDGNAVFNAPRVWVGRDDWLEIDDTNGRTWTINDGFFENLFVWLSVTWERTPGGLPNSFIYANNCLVHFRVWDYRPTTPGPDQSQGPFIKANAGSLTNLGPKLRFNNVCMVIQAAQTTVDDSRVINALQQCQAINGSRLLVLGGTYPNRNTISAFQNAGFSVLEDGSGTAATQEWNTRKENFLDEVTTPPPTVSTLESPATFNVNVGSGPTLTAPVILSSTTTASLPVQSLALNTPAWETGDLILIYTGLASGDDAWASGMTVTTVGGETIRLEQALVGNDINNNQEQALGIYSFVAASDRAAGTNITVDWGYSDGHHHTVVRVQKDTFITGPTNRLAMVTRTLGPQTDSVPVSAALTSAPEKSVPFSIAQRRYSSTSDTDWPPAGWTVGVRNRFDFTTINFMYKAALTTTENVAAANFCSNTGSSGWVALTGVILPKGYS